MPLFWILAGLMTAAALVVVLLPMLRARVPGGPSTTDANLEVLRSQRREIEADVANGSLPAQSREEALAELVARAEEDLANASPPVAPAARPLKVAIAVAIAIPAIAFGIYGFTGNPNASDARAVAAAPSPMNDAQIVAMVENLARKVKDRPDDAQGWGLLARSMAALGRFKEAADAYEHLNRLEPGNPQVLADYADALGMAEGRTLAGKPYELVREALKIDPKHRKALALAGTAALDAGDFKAAVGNWEALAAQLEPGSADAQQVQQILAEVSQRAAQAGKPVTLAQAPKAAASASPVVAMPKAPAAPAAAGKTVTGSVSLAPALAAKVSGAEILFIFARSEGGPRVPLAVVRGTASELPRAFTLDDSQAMAPGMTISSAQAVRIEARVSRSGNATPQPGDLVGTSGVVPPGARDVKIVVDKVLP